MLNFSQTLSRGRIAIAASCRLLGRDLQITVSGGSAHIGAVCLAMPGGGCDLLERDGHRDGEIAAAMAKEIAAKTGRCAVVCAGIHYEAITRAEIGAVRDLAARLAREISAFYNFQKEETMLNMQELADFENYLRSGELEARFKQAGEIERGRILELLEKLMDVADLADEVATRLIFRGLPLPADRDGKD